jgi:hypothetical protein
MRNEQGKGIIYSFSCPLPCNRKISVEAENFLDAIDKIIKAGAMGCRSSRNKFLCKNDYLEMPPIPERHLENIVSLCTQEEFKE